MRAPLGLVGAALALWGVSIGFAWLGVAAAIAFESMRSFGGSARERAARIEPRLARLTALLVIAFLGYVVATQSLPHSLYAWLRWLPVALLPLAMLQPLLGRDRDLTHAYAAIALAAAGTGAAAQAWLYAGFVAIVAWALLDLAPRPRRKAAAAMLAVAAVLGYGVHLSIAALQGQVEEWSTELMADFLAGKPDALRERTRIGDLGRIKLSDRIVMRVAVEGPRPDGLLLRESAFDRYRNGEWIATHRAPRAAAFEGGRWKISEGEGPSRLTLRRSLPGGEALLALPPGTRSVASLPARKLEVFPSGAVLASGTPRLVAIGVTYDAAGERDAPTPADREVPAALAAAIARVAADERLGGLDEIRAFFASKFAYSLDLGDARRGPRTLAGFLLADRKGHCEYFAAATVLLLRQAGIPARYVGGYSVQEYSEREQAFVVRARHAHAWASAFVGGRWIEVDTTPARWAEFEGEAARGFLGPLWDRLSWLVDRLAAAWIDAPLADIGLAAAAVLALALAAVATFLAARRRRRRPASAAPSRDPIAAAWHAVEQRMARAGHARAPQETARQWIARLRRGGATPEELASLSEAYYRARFDPAATPESRSRFLDSARAFERTISSRREAVS